MAKKGPTLGTREELFEARCGVFGSCWADPLIAADDDEHEPVIVQRDAEKIPELPLVLAS
ncbi:hypothetical protein ASG92_22315 [Arthrobacter sp. Soil736]|uniref:hypothetical protein n=1 Tax=Arthrobacter sp. Soil736 TaxID=1736395 RepID=UPI0006F6D3B1|nr:hypothetical protein [Arthrobacter sp. Soil736]KRE60020.1 hypothetical protein ASG92_22315 [Arthrobacter sp. Soil736]